MTLSTELLEHTGLGDRGSPTPIPTGGGRIDWEAQWGALWDDGSTGLTGVAVRL